VFDPLGKNNSRGCRELLEKRGGAAEGGREWQFS